MTITQRPHVTPRFSQTHVGPEAYSYPRSVTCAPTPQKPPRAPSHAPSEAGTALWVPIPRHCSPENPLGTRVCLVRDLRLTTSLCLHSNRSSLSGTPRHLRVKSYDVGDLPQNALRAGRAEPHQRGRPWVAGGAGCGPPPIALVRASASPGDKHV